MAPDLEAVLFSVKSFTAAILALYVSLSIGLTNPFWAIGAVYTVSQPFSGASVSRSFFRFLGTIGGAAATVALVSTFANEPLVLSVALASWTGFCLYLAAVDRTPRAYAFQLAGYMTCLIGFPYVAQAGEIFNVAIVRVQEVSIGILFATLLHTLVLPRSVSDRVKARVAGLLGDAERWTRDTLVHAREAVLVHDRVKVAVGLLDLHQNAIHLPFDSARAVPRVEILRTLHDRLLTVLSLSSAVDDSLAELQTDARDMPARLSRIIEQVRSWLDAPERILDPDKADNLLRELRDELRGTSGSGDWRDLLLANLASDLRDLVVAHQDCRLLQQELTEQPGWMRRLPPRLIGRGKGYVLQRDHWLAARSGIGAMVGITLCCLFWIASGWVDGASSLFVVGPTCVLCGTIDAPIGGAIRSMVGMVVGIAGGLVYGFVIIPSTTDFVSLVAVLAPLLLLSGSAQARPPLAFAAVSMILTFPAIAGLAPTNASNFASAGLVPTSTSDFVSVLNCGLAALIGGVTTLVSLVLFQTIGIDYRTGRILRAIRHDVAMRAAGGHPDTVRWTSRMLDRIGLLIPRLAGNDQSTNLLRYALADLRMGQAAGGLRALEKTLNGRTARAMLSGFLDDVVAYFRSRTTSGDERSVRHLLAQLDGVKDAMVTEADPVRERALPLLSALRRDLLLRVIDHGM
ncbi:FUSC family protein [Telmatospirillum sp.]|uniref:FUSC family protein n=1 Tax=Telmatospirillum sp. TaxID=2079197 RepID=UPI00284CB43A|nr:FUSC family protein [Telmatospirillum sp.]MDR3435293.1 FUSC family protein [Telmatospirillum sp.]